MNCSHLGIDVSKLKLDVALLAGDSVHRAVFPNTLTGFGALDQWLARFPSPVRICLEATGAYGLGVARFLHQRQKAVSIVNPLRIHHFARVGLARNKTDAHDAEIIARFSQQNHPRLWQPPAPQRERLQELVRVREQLLDSLVLAKQHLESAPCAIAHFFQTQIRHLDRQIEKAENQIRQAWQADPLLVQSVQWLTSIPGVGEITAVTVLAILPPLEQVKSARQLAAFAGVTPSQRQSGQSAGQTRMSKLGHGRLRKALFLPAVAALRFNPRAKALAQRLAAKGKRKMVIVGAVMRLLTHLIFGVLKNRAPFDPNHLNPALSN